MASRHYTVPGFWSFYNRLPDDVQRLADRGYALLQAFPDHPSLRFKRVGKLHSVRVGLHYRALATERKEGFVWFWIGHHAEYELLIQKHR
jgi:hypothetical protein